MQISRTESDWLMTVKRIAATFCTALLLLCVQPSFAADSRWLPNFPTAEGSLAGTLWNLRTQTKMTPEQLIASLPNGAWLMIGENHENSDHHQIETALINQLAERELLGAVALEMADHSQQERLDQHLGKPPELITAEQLAWKSGWPWEWYHSTVSAALYQATRVLAADLTREEQLDAYRTGITLTAEPAYTDFMLELLYQSHCRQMPRSQLGNMLRVQRARDQQMATILKEHTDTERINLLIAGSAHTRYDIGIPHWHGDLNSKTLLLLSETEAASWQSQLPESYTSDPIADYVLFTPQITAKDHCSEQ